MKTLSGGEKSYSTISLVLALWSQIQPPFRILDEFDVFMDSLNRRIALDQIINYAKVLSYSILNQLLLSFLDTSSRIDKMLTHIFFILLTTFGNILSKAKNKCFIREKGIAALVEDLTFINIVHDKPQDMCQSNGILQAHRLLL